MSWASSEVGSPLDGQLLHHVVVLEGHVTAMEDDEGKVGSDHKKRPSGGHLTAVNSDMFDPG